MMNGIGFRRKRSSPNFKVLSRYSPEETEENHEKLCHVSRFSDRDVNLQPLKYTEI
jgi:hypothetical protein